jgi:hypothetical protein
LAYCFLIRDVRDIGLSALKAFLDWPTDEGRWPSLVWNEPLALKQNLQNTLFQLDLKL